MADRMVEIDGHKVIADRVDLFYSGKDGERITDAEWDESKRRIENAEMLDTDPDSPLVTWVPVRDYNGDGGNLGTDTA